MENNIDKEGLKKDIYQVLIKNLDGTASRYSNEIKNSKVINRHIILFVAELNQILYEMYDAEYRLPTTEEEKKV